MSDREPRIGVIGLGSIGQHHVSTWTTLGYKPVAVADVVPAARERAERDLQCAVYATGEDLIASGDLDIVSICTPPAFHKDLAIAATKAGLTVLCEKPLASTLDDAEAIASAVELSGAPFAVGFCHRFEPAVEVIREMIANGTLGTVAHIRNRFAGHLERAETTWFSNAAVSGGGALADTAIHSIDLFRDLAGEIVEVRALTSTHESDLGPALSVEDSGTIVVRSEPGVIGMLEASWRTPPGEWTLTVYGSKGSIRYDYASGALEQHLVDSQPATVPYEAGDRFAREFASVVPVWRGEDSPRAGVEDGVVANRVLAQAYADAAR